MGELFLELGRIMAVIGCVASVVGGFNSLSAIIRRWKDVTNEMMGRFFYWVYVLGMNAALVVVFSTLIK